VAVSFGGILDSIVSKKAQYFYWGNFVVLVAVDPLESDVGFEFAY
jgi:hypothetical protein